MTYRPFLALCSVALAAACGDGRAAPPSGPVKVTLETGQQAHDDQAYSPDGTTLAFTARIRGDDGVYVVAASGGTARLVSQLAGDVNDPSWSPDGSTLVYAAFDPAGGRDLYSVAVVGGDPVRLTRLRAEVDQPLYSPDGARILFQSDHTGRPILWTIPSTGGDPEEVAPDTPGAKFDGRWSPDGSRIAMTLGLSENRTVVAVFDFATGALAQLTSEGMEGAPEWSPDGNTLAYESSRTGAPDLWTIPASGGEPSQLTVDVRGDWEPVYSPDGRWIAYGSGRGGQPDLWVIPAAGGEAIRVTNDRSNEMSLRWTPDGQGLAFLYSNDRRALYTVSTDGGTLRPLTDPDVASIEPDVSPDGQQVVYQGRRDGLWGIYSIPIGGGDEHPLVTGWDNEEPRWSPDGGSVLFTSHRDLQPAVWVVSVATGEQRQISPVGMPANGGVWSPEGDRILFGAFPAERGLQFIEVPASGGEPRIIADDQQVRWADWSPDGSYFYLMKSTGGAAGVGIYRLPVSGGAAELLTAGQVVAGPPRWSPDGQRMAYTAVSADGGALDVFVMAPDGSGKQRLTSDPEREAAAAWSVDGAEVHFANGFYGMASISLATGARRIIFDGELRLRDWAISPDRSTLVVMAHSDQIKIATVDVRGVVGGRE